MWIWCVFVIVFALPQQTTAFWITDYYPQEYDVGTTIPIKANSMVSEHHPNEPQDYYSLGFCEARKSSIVAARRAENLGEILIGDKVLPTLYSVDMKVDRREVKTCSRNYNVAEIKEFRNMVSKSYRVRWLLDSLPNVQPLQLKDSEGVHSVTLYEQGYDLGYLPDKEDEDGVYVYSRVDIEVDFHDKRIVGFRTVPTLPVLLHPRRDDQDSVEWTYSVKWVSTSQPWGSRWDVYGLNNAESKSVYLLSTLISLLFILCISMYLRQKLGRRILQNLGMDRSRMSIQQVSADIYSVSLAPAGGGEEDSGDLDNIDLERDRIAPWTLIKDWVYLPPAAPELLCALVGAGVQILTILLTTALLAMLGILYAAHRGLLINCVLVTFFLTSGVNSFASAWLYKALALRRRDDIANFAVSFFLFPVLLLLIVIPVNIILQHRHAASSIRWTILGMLIFGWLAISFFTSCIGYYLGKSRAVKHLRIENMPRSIPVSYATGGVLPHAARLAIGFLSFLVLWIPLKFIYMSIWGTLFYQLYTLQWVSMLLWLFFTTELCIAHIFWQLNEENYRWWWASYGAGAAVALPSLLYSIVYYALNSDITSFASLVIYFGYALLFSLIIALLSGSICFLGVFFFVRRTYTLFKID